MLFKSIYILPNHSVATNSLFCLNNARLYIHPPAVSTRRLLASAAWWADLNPLTPLNHLPFQKSQTLKLPCPYHPYHPPAENAGELHPLDLWTPEILFLAILDPDTNRPVPITQDRLDKAGIRRLTLPAPTGPNLNHLNIPEPFDPLDEGFLASFPVLSGDTFESPEELRETGFIRRLWPLTGQVGANSTLHWRGGCATPRLAFALQNPDNPRAVALLKLLTMWLVHKAPRLRPDSHRQDELLQLPTANPSSVSLIGQPLDRPNDRPSSKTAGVVAAQTGLGLFALTPPRVILDRWRSLPPETFSITNWARNPFIPDTSNPTAPKKPLRFAAAEEALLQFISTTREQFHNHIRTAISISPQNTPHAPNQDPTSQNQGPLVIQPSHRTRQTIFSPTVVGKFPTPIQLLNKAMSISNHAGQSATSANQDDLHTEPVLIPEPLWLEDPRKR